MPTSLFNTASQVSSLLLPRTTIHIQNTWTDPMQETFNFGILPLFGKITSYHRSSFSSFGGNVFILVLG